MVSPSYNSGPRPQYNSGVRPPYNPSSGRGRGRSNGVSRPQCQLCGKFGHMVHRCYFRFDPSFAGIGSGFESMLPPSTSVLEVHRATSTNFSQFGHVFSSGMDQVSWPYSSGSDNNSMFGPYSQSMGSFVSSGISQSSNVSYNPAVRQTSSFHPPVHAMLLLCHLL